jgi:hypothetical protein
LADPRMKVKDTKGKEGEMELRAFFRAIDYVQPLRRCRINRSFTGVLCVRFSFEF